VVPTHATSFVVIFRSGLGLETPALGGSGIHSLVPSCDFPLVSTDATGVEKQVFNLYISYLLNLLSLFRSHHTPVVPSSPGHWLAFPLQPGVEAQFWEDVWVGGR
jgi:hypothetical protein